MTLEISPAAMGQLVSAISSNAPKGSGSTHRATVLRTDNDGTTWVSIPGGADETPLHGTLIECAPGDVVDVTIANGRATATANATSPAATGRTVGVVRQTAETAQATADGAVTRVARLEADHVSVAELEAEHALIVELDADKASIADLSAATARIGTLESNTADIGTIRANAAKVQNLTAAELEADHAKVGRLDADQIAADHATLGTVSADYLKAADMTAERARVDTLLAGKADISTLEADYITAAQIEAGYMHADMANADVAWIQNGIIRDGAIVNAMIASVSANKLTAGTIDASNITVTNLNADNITTGTINGQRIGQGSLSLDKLADDVYTESEVDAKLSTMQDQIDGAIETWTGTAVPTLSNAPANGWTTTADRDKHVGDVYFVVNSQSQQNGYNYRFTKSGTTYSWQLIKDSDVTAALQRLSTVEGEITQFDEDISTLQTDTGSLKTRATNLETRMSTAEGSIATKVDSATFNELSSTVDGNTASITSLSNVTQTLANPNLSPYYSHGKDNQYWTSASYPTASSELGEIGTILSDGWMHVEMDNSARTGWAYLNSWLKPQAWVKNSQKYTWLVEVRNLSFASGSYIRSYPAQNNTTSPWVTQTGTNAYKDISADGSYYIVSTSRANAETLSEFGTFSRGYISVPAGTNATFDIRMSVYEGEYSGPYKPYISSTEFTELSNTVNTVSQTATSNSSKISQLTTTLGTNADGTTKAGDVVHRTSAVEQDLSGFKTTVASTYATQASVDAIQVGGRNLLPISTAGVPKTGNGLTVTYEGEGWIRVTGTASNTSNTVIQLWGTTDTDTTIIDGSDSFAITVEDDGVLVNGKIGVQVYGNDGTANRYHIVYAAGGYVYTDMTARISRVCIYLNAAANGTAVNGRFRIKLERGNMPSDWTPAPEDAEDVAQSVRNLCKNTAKPTVNTSSATQTMRSKGDWFSFSANATVSKTADGVRLDYVGTSSTPGLVIPLVDGAEIADGERLTVSFTYRGTISNMGSVYLLHALDPNSSQGSGPAPIPDGAWHHWERSFSFVPNASATAKVAALMIGYYRNAAGTWFEIKDGTLVLERGDMATRVTAAETSIEQNAEQIALRATKAEMESATNMLLDADAPTLAKVVGPDVRYFSDAAATMITTSLFEVADPPEPGIHHGARFVCDGTQTVAKARALTFYGGQNSTNLPLKAGATYTVSYWARVTSGGGQTLCQIRENSANKQVVSYTAFPLTSEWQRCTGTFTHEAAGGDYERIWFYSRFPTGMAGTVELCGFKLVPGDSAEAVRGYASSELSVQAGQISSKVSANGVISAINQSAESVTIQASKVNVAGMITAINDDTTTTIDGGKITANSLAIGATSGLQTALDGKATTGSVTSAANAANTIVTVYPTAIDYAAGTATLAVKCMRGSTSVTPSAYKWTKGTATTSLGTGSTLAVTDLDAVYNCTVTFSA